MSPHDYPDEEKEFTRQEVAELKRLAGASRMIHSVAVALAAVVAFIGTVIAAGHALLEMWRDAK